MLMVSAHPSATCDSSLQLFLQVSAPRAKLCLYHDPGVWLFICVGETAFHPERTFENTFIFPSSSTRREVVQVRSIGHCVTEIFCVGFPWNVAVNLKPLYQKKRQDNGS